MADDLDVQLPTVIDEPVFGAILPAIVAATHEDASERFLEFFAAPIRNANTRAAYVNAVADFLRFPPVAALASLAQIRSIHVSAYIESRGDRFAPQTVKQRLAALRGLFDWLARHGVLATNPAAPVRGPAYSCKRGKTPILTSPEAKRLIESIETDSAVGLRDGALIAVMVYSFARISAAVGMDVESLVQTAGRSWLRLHKKGGKVHEMPVHHRLLEHLDAYMAALEGTDAKSPLFRAALGRTGKLGAERLNRHDAYAMVRRRAVKAGVIEKIATIRSAGRGSQPTWKMMGRWNSRRRWPITPPRARPSSTIGAAIRSLRMRWSGFASNSDARSKRGYANAVTPSALCTVVVAPRSSS